MFILLWKVKGSAFFGQSVDYRIIESDDESVGIEQARRIKASFQSPTKEYPCSVATDFVLFKIDGPVALVL